jgi:hypothetical protein
MTGSRAVDAAACGGSALVIFALATSPDAHIAQLLLTVLLGLMALPVLARHPTATLCALVVFLPLQVAALAWLFDHGAPLVLVRRLGALKDLFVLGLVLRALRDRWPGSGRRADPWMLAYVGAATLYLFLPAVIPSLAQIPFSQRLLAWRVDVLFVVLLLALRRIDPAALRVGALRWTVIGVSGVVAAGAVYEHYDPSAWTDLLYQTLGVTHYSVAVLNIPLSDQDLIRYASDGTVRSGSFLREPVFCAFYLLPGFFLAITRISSRRSFLATALTALIGLGLLATSTRSALLVGLLGAALVTVLVLRSSSRRTTYFVPVLAVLLVVAPLAIAQSSVLHRVGQAASGTDESTQGHQKDLAKGLERAFTDPVGTGLGTGAGVGQRFDVAGQVTTENAYLQVINEMGLLALLPFVLLLGLLVRELLGLTGIGRLGSLDRIAALAVAQAMILGGFLQTVWLDFGVGVSAVVVLALPGLVRDQLQRRTTSLTAPSNHSAVAVPASIGSYP